MCIARPHKIALRKVDVFEFLLTLDVIVLEADWEDSRLRVMNESMSRWYGLSKRFQEKLWVPRLGLEAMKSAKLKGLPDSNAYGNCTIVLAVGTKERL